MLEWPLIDGSRPLSLRLKVGVASLILLLSVLNWQFWLIGPLLLAAVAGYGTFVLLTPSS